LIDGLMDDLAMEAYQAGTITIGEAIDAVVGSRKLSKNLVNSLFRMIKADDGSAKREKGSCFETEIS